MKKIFFYTFFGLLLYSNHQLISLATPSRLEAAAFQVSLKKSNLNIFSNDQVQSVSQQNGEYGDPDPLFLIITKSGQKYMAKSEPQARKKMIYQVAQSLQKLGLTKIHGKHQYAGKTYFLYNFAEGELVNKSDLISSAKDSRFENFMKTAVKMEKALASLKQNFSDVKPKYSPIEAYYKANPSFPGLTKLLKKKRDSDLLPIQKTYLENANWIEEQAKLAKQHLPKQTYDDLPHVFMHADYKLGHVRFDHEGEVTSIIDLSGAGMVARIHLFLEVILYDGADTYTWDDLVKAVAYYNHYSNEPLPEETIKLIPELLRTTYLSWSLDWFKLKELKSDQKTGEEETVYNRRIQKEIEIFKQFAKDFPADGYEGKIAQFVNEVNQGIKNLGKSS